MPSMYRTAAGDANGHFVFRGVPPGDYELFSWEEHLQTAEQDDAYLEQYKDRGARITVRAQGANMADVHVIPRGPASR